LFPALELFLHGFTGWPCESWLAFHFAFTLQKEIFYVALAKGIKE
jgi:hypothetical protein